MEINQLVEDNTMKKIIDYIPDGICVLELIGEQASTIIKVWNRQLTNLSGYTLNEAKEIGLNNIFNFDIKDISLSNEKSLKYCSITNKEGNTVCISVNSSVLQLDYNNKSIILSFRPYELNSIEILDKNGETKLENSEAFYKMISENSIDMISTTDTKGTLKYVTPSHYTITGYTQEQIVGMNLKDCMFEEQHKKNLDKFLDELKEEKKQKKIQWKCKRASGGYLNMETFAKPLFKDGDLKGYLFSSRDLTERIEIEEALRKSEEKFRNLFNSVNDAIYLHVINEDGTPGKIVEANEVAYKKIGLTKEQFLAMNSYELSTNIDREKAMAFTKEILEKKQMVKQTTMKMKDGSIRYGEANSILFSANNEKYVISISRDITERLRQENALRESEERYRLLLEAIPYGVFIRTKDRILFSNKAGLDYLKVISLEEVRNKRILDIVKPHPSFLKDLIKSIKYLEDNGSIPLSEEKYIRLSDNEILELETITIKIPYEQAEETYLAVIRDISDRKKAEKLEKDMIEKSRLLLEAVEYERLRTEFFANISHELRTPLNVILSALQLVDLNFNMEQGKVNSPEKFARYIAIMKQNCFRLIRLINNLIDVTKIDAGFLELNLSNNDIVNIVEEITLSIADYIDNKGIVLVFDTDVEEKIMACDPDKIERIILNLISNAVKFTDIGGRIDVKIYDKGDMLRISVKDTGVGIPNEKQASIFERFVQVDKSLARSREGSGIGLSLVKSLVEMHKGNIVVKSECGKGSEFIIELPIYLIERDGGAKVSENFLLGNNIEKIDIEFSDIY